MHRQWVFSCALAVLSWSFSLLGQASEPLAAPSSISPPSAGHDGCSAYLMIAPLDQNVLKLLGTPIVPANEGLAASSGFQQLRAWDFPSKVTPWSARPSPDELARRRIELSKAARSVVLISNPYDLQTMSPHDWNELEKWFRKEVPRKLPGACVDPNQAMYVVVVGVILDGSTDESLRNSSARNEYKQSAMARQQDSSVGANAATVPPVAQNSQELSGMGTASDSSVPGAHTCTFLYRKPAGQGPLQTPDYYYCRSDSIMPHSAITTMLKYFANLKRP
jgi:hypothetical protein